MGQIRIGTTTMNRTGRRSGDGVPAKFDVAARINTSTSEASDVVALPNGKLAIVSDTTKKLHLVDDRGRESKVELEHMHGTSELEGIAYDPVKKKLFVSREEDRQVWRYSWDPEQGDPKFEKKIDVGFGGPENKGVEGLTYLPEEFSPTGEAQLLMAREGQPRQLLMYRDSGKGDPLKVELEPQVKDVLKDFSAVAVDPKSGNLFLSSDESSTVAQVRLLRDGNSVRARLIQAIPIRTHKDKPLARIEGLAFNPKGDLYVLTENDGALHELKRK